LKERRFDILGFAAFGLLLGITIHRAFEPIVVLKIKVNQVNEIIFAGTC